MLTTSPQDANLLATHYAPLASQPQQCYHHCFWVVGLGPAICNAFVLGHEFSEHLRTDHVPAGTDKTLVMCCWAGCSSEMKKESLMRHVQEKHLEWKYTCPNCFERFTRNYTRDQHVTRKHSN